MGSVQVNGAIITMGLAISLIVTIMEILNGFLDTDKEKIKMAQTFNCTKLQLLTKIVIPANISTFINSLKIFCTILLSYFYEDFHR